MIWEWKFPCWDLFLVNKNTNKMIWIILLLALMLRLININQSLWLDEATQAILSSKSLEYIWFQRGGDFHPPLSYILTHFWLMLGSSEIWLRFLPVLFGVGTVYGVYLLGKKMVDQKLGLLAALFLAIAPYHIYYSQEFRMYSQVTFFATWSIYFLLTTGRRAFISTTGALIYTHYMGLFVIAAQFLYILGYQKKQLSLYLKNSSLVLVLYLPWLPQFLTQLQVGVNIDQYLPGWRDILSLSLVKALPLTFIKFSLGRIDFENVVFYGLVAIVVLGVFGLLLLRGVQSAWRQNQLLLYWLAVPVLLSFLISFKIPLYQPFRLLLVLPAFYLLIALGISSLGKWKKWAITAVIFVSLSGLLLYYTDSKFQREDWRGATEAFPNAVFAWPVPFDPYIWYGGKGIGVVKHFPAKENEVAQNLANAKLENRVYVFEYLQALSDPQRITQLELIKNGYKLIKTQNFRGVGFVNLYQR